MPILPLFFDTIPGLGANKIHDACPYPFLLLPERFETLAVVVTFSPFWAGKSHRHAKIWCVFVHHRHGVSPPKQNKKYIREGSKRERKCTGPNFWRENEISARPGCDRDGAARRPIPGEHELPVKDLPQKKGVSPSYGLRFGHA